MPRSVAIAGRALLLAALVLCHATAVAGAELAGRIDLDGRGARGADASAAVVWFEPTAGAEPPEPGAFVIETREKAFAPRVLAVPRGSRVRFPNRDPILHNAFSVSRGNAFDLGLIGKGPGAEKVFDQPGLVRVFCNVHHGMVAYILVLDTPHYTSPGPDGRFHLSGLPNGPGRLKVWHEQAEETTRELTVPATSQLALALEISRPRVPRHLNKLGKSYGRSRRDRY